MTSSFLFGSTVDILIKPNGTELAPPTVTEVDTDPTGAAIAAGTLGVLSALTENGDDTFGATYVCGSKPGTVTINAIAVSSTGDANYSASGIFTIAEPTATSATIQFTTG